MPSFDTLLNAFVTLFVTAGPLSIAPLFLSLTEGMDTAERRGIAVRGVSVAFFILTLFAVTGTGVLDAMGIGVDAFRVAGGLLLFFTAFQMIYGGRQERRAQVSEAAAEEQGTDIAVFPLAIPLLAGPGTIAATVLLSSQLSSGGGAGYWSGRAILVGLLLVLMAMTGIALVAADRLDRYLGDTARTVVARLLGVLLAALAVQYVADGVRALAGRA